MLDGDDIDDYELVSVCETRTFDGGDRVVVLDNAQKIKGKAIEAYIEDKSADDDSVVLAAIVRGNNLPKLWAKAAEKGKAIEYPKYKPWQQDKQIRRIEAEAKTIKVKLARGIPELMLKVIGDDLRQIVNELKKLVYIVGENGTVEKKHLALVLTHMYPAEPWDVANAAAAGNPKRAMTLLSFLYKHMGEGASVPITIALMSLVRKLVVARQILDRGEPESVAAVSLGMHEFAFKKNVLPLAKRHPVDRLLKQMVDLCRLESQVKGPARSKRTLVELAVLSLAA